MPECHTCEHDGRAHAVCLKCKGPSEPSHHGRSHISIDSGISEQGQSLGEVEASMAKPIIVEPLDSEPDGMDMARRAIYSILSLPIADIELLQHVCSGRSMPDYARARGLSPSGAKRRLSDMIRRHPELESAVRAGH